MKKFLILSGLFGLAMGVKGQILLEDKKGDQIANNVFNFKAGGGVKSLSLIKLNTSDQSLGFSYFTTTALHDPSNFHVNEFSVKAKPTEGYAAAFSSGQFSPGVRLAYSFTQVQLFTNFKPGASFADWGGFTITYDIDKYQLYRKDTTFANQVYPKSFKGLGVTASYNALIKQHLILGLRLGYARTSTYDDLKSMQVNDVIRQFDSASSTQRELIQTKTARPGKYEEYDSYPMILSITRATRSDDTASGDTAKLRLGYTLFIKNVARNNLPKTSMGVIFFLTKQDKAGIRSPVFGLMLQAKDPFDVAKKNDGLQNRLEIGFTSVFTL